MAFTEGSELETALNRAETSSIRNDIQVTSALLYTSRDSRVRLNISIRKPYLSIISLGFSTSKESRERGWSRPS